MKLLSSAEFQEESEKGERRRKAKKCLIRCVILSFFRRFVLYGVFSPADDAATARRGRRRRRRAVCQPDHSHSAAPESYGTLTARLLHHRVAVVDRAGNGGKWLRVYANIPGHSHLHALAPCLQQAAGSSVIRFHLRSTVIHSRVSFALSVFSLFRSPAGLRISRLSRSLASVFSLRIRLPRFRFGASLLRFLCE